MRKNERELQKVFIGNANIYPDAIHCYSTPINGFDISNRHKRNQFNLNSNGTRGKISYKASKSISKAIIWLLYKAKPKWIVDRETGNKYHFKINFITLTLPAKQAHTDQVIKAKCLNSFLTIMRTKYKLTNYMWRAEAQANGNIHFHLVTDIYIHHTDIRKHWNSVVENLGYVSRFYEKFKHRDPNSIDVHSVKHVRKLASYLSKYFGKNKSFACIGELRLIKGEQVEVLYGSRQYKSEAPSKKQGKVIGHVLGGLIRPIEGRLWFASKSISGVKPIRVNESEYEWSTLEEVLRSNSLRTCTSEYVSSYYGKIEDELQGKASVLYERLKAIKVTTT